MLNSAIKLTLVLALVSCFFGCDEPVALRPRYDAASPVLTDDPEPASDRTAEPAYLRGQSVEKASNMPGDGAVSKAMHWAEKYAEVSNELRAAHARISELERETRKLNAQLAASNATLTATQNELADANLMLEEMKRDLQQWRNNVLGFRKEIADAQAAQLRAMQQILEYLGADVSKSNGIAQAKKRR